MSVGPAARSGEPPEHASAAQIAPEYGGRWVGAIVPALIARRPPPGLPDWTAPAGPVVLLVIDGLGWRMVERFTERLPATTALHGGPVTTVVPSTTAAALTSITTGRSPAEHGVVGYRMRVGGAVLVTLQWRVETGQPLPAPEAVQPHPPFLGHRVPVVSRAQFADSGFTRAHLRDVPFHPWNKAHELVGAVQRCLAGGARIVFAYYDDVDKAAHAHGLQHEATARALLVGDRLVWALRRSLPQDGVLVVTSDHGQVEVPRHERVSLAPLAGFVSATSGEGRFRALHARPGAARDLLSAARELAAGRAQVYEREAVFDKGWLGPPPNPVIAGRLGDVVLVATGRSAFMDPSVPKEDEMVTMHGSLTPDEMLVPLLAGRGLGHRDV